MYSSQEQETQNNYEHPDTKRERIKRTQDNYFSCYTDLSIHQTMLKDQTRTLAYRHAIEANKHLFEGKVVLDIGAGTLILSLFAAEHATKVYAVEYAGINRFSKEICRQNNLEDKIILVNCKAENVVDQIPDKVDIIISEWMGYALFFQDMINTVIKCSERWLKPDGLLFPQKAKIYLSLGSNKLLYEENVTFWLSVYGYCMKPCLQETLTQIHVLDCSKSQLADTCEIYDLDIKTRKEEFEDEYFRCPFQLKGGLKMIDHFVIWFDVEFPGGGILSTSPRAPLTHWKQCVIFLKEPTLFPQGLKGEISFCKHPKYNRKIAVGLKYQWGQMTSQNEYFMV